MCPACGVLMPEGAAADPMIGSVMGGRYKVVRLLGEGGMGAVYQAEQQMGTTVRKVAIKTLHPHLSKDPKIMARFERECGTVAELEHPNTIQVYDFGKNEDGILYIVMEFIQGDNLAGLLEKGGPMLPARVEKIMTQVCGSLEEAHSRGIVHRDLKPDNIVLTERAGQKDWVKVLDFGIAKRSSEEDKNEQKLTQQGMVLGTPPYMSPEQFTGKPIDARSDIYSLGVMAYEMLTGRLPFEANTAWEWATQHMTVPPLAMESTAGGARVPTKMRQAIMRSLEKLPENRFATVREFIDAFSGGSVGSIPVPRRATAPEQAVAAPVHAPAPVNSDRGKTQMGEPMVMPPGAFGAGMAMPAPSHAQQPSYANPGGGARAATPAAGNHAFPTPAGIPQAPQHSARGGGGGGGGKSNTPIFAAIGVIGVLSIGAVVFAMMPKKPTVVDEPHLFAEAGAAAVELVADAAIDPGPTPVDTGLAVLKTSTAPIPTPVTPPKKVDAGAKPVTPTPSTPPVTPPVTPPPAGDPPSCVEARNLKARAASDPTARNAFPGKMRECFAAGGKL